jgi:hypothetical protein
MPWVRFTRRFDFFVLPKVCYSYKSNKNYLVKQACADQAIKQGSAILIERPKSNANNDHAKDDHGSG